MILGVFWELFAVSWVSLGASWVPFRIFLVALDVFWGPPECLLNTCRFDVGCLLGTLGCLLGLLGRFFVLFLLFSRLI